MTKSIETFRGGVFPWEIDIMGHMNVRHYTAKYDDATLQLFGALGLTIAYFKEQDRGMAAVQQNMTYGRELLAGDLIEIKSEILEAGERKIKFLHRMYECLGGDEASTCETPAFTLTARCAAQRPFRRTSARKHWN
ncbi:MAG: acyl-CoA thioesterase [Alphaproteobacteria bacterium]